MIDFSNITKKKGDLVVKVEEESMLPLFHPEDTLHIKKIMFDDLKANGTVLVKKSLLVSTNNINKDRAALDGPLLAKTKLNRLLGNFGYPKVLIVSPHQAFTGYRTYTSNLEEYFKKDRGVLLHHLVLFRHPQKKYYDNINPPQGLQMVFRKIARFFLTFFDLKKFIKSGNYDVIVGMGLLANFLIILIRVIYKINYRIITTVHKSAGGERLSLVRRLFRFMPGFTIHHLSDVTICVSKNLTAEIRKKFRLRKEKCITIYNGIDVEKINRLSKEKDKTAAKKIKKALSEKTKKIFMMGRLDKDKDFPILLEAFKQVTKKVNNVVLFIIGVGPLYELLTKKAEELGLKDNVYFLGATENPFYYLNQADIYVHSSKREGFSLAIVEAMALGKPVVATNCPHGPKEIIGKDKYGFIVPVGDVKKMAEKILLLLVNLKVYNKYSTLARKRAQYFNLEKMGKKYEAVFKRSAKI